MAGSSPEQPHKVVVVEDGVEEVLPALLEGDVEEAQLPVSPPPPPCSHHHHHHHHHHHPSTSSSSSSSSASAPASTALPWPCQHNSWDNVRIKRGWAILRCRVCSRQWRLRPSEIPRCPDFGRDLTSQCPRGEACDLVHIHYARFKRERVLQERRTQPAQLACRA